jgi:hypothetical protein
MTPGPAGTGAGRADIVPAFNGRGLSPAIDRLGWDAIWLFGCPGTDCRFMLVYSLEPQAWGRTYFPQSIRSRVPSRWGEKHRI